MLRILSYPGHGPQRRDWLADDAVGCELVSAPNSLLTEKLTGNFANSGPQQRFPHLINELIQRLAANSLRNGTGNSCSPNRKFFRENREFKNLIERAAKALSCCRDVELARPLMSTPLALLRHSKIGGLPAFGGRAGCSGHRRRCAGISSGTAPKFLLAAPAQPSNRAARGRAL